MFEVHVRDSQVTGRVAVGSATLPLSCLPLKGGKASLWLPLKPPPPPGMDVLTGGINKAGDKGACASVCTCVSAWRRAGVCWCVRESASVLTCLCTCARACARGLPR